MPVVQGENHRFYKWIAELECKLQAPKRAPEFAKFALAVLRSIKLVWILV